MIAELRSSLAQMRAVVVVLVEEEESVVVGCNGKVGTRTGILGRWCSAGGTG